MIYLAIRLGVELFIWQLPLPLFCNANGHYTAHPTSVRPMAAPSNGIDRTLPSIVEGILTVTGLNFVAGGENIERKVRDGGNGDPNPM